MKSTASTRQARNDELREHFTWILQRLAEYEVHLTSDGRLWSAGRFISENQVKCCLRQDIVGQFAVTNSEARRLAETAVAAAKKKLQGILDKK